MPRFGNWVRSSAIIVALVAGFTGIGFVVVASTPYSWGWVVTEAAPGVGAVASVILIWYYARLYRASQEQSKAARASYAPDLDVTVVSEVTNHVELRIVNRGEGVAKQITIEMMLKVDGEEYAYRAHLNQSMQPGQVVTGPVGDGASSSHLDLYPRFYIEANGQYYRGELAHLVAVLKENDQNVTHPFTLVVTYTDIIEDTNYVTEQRARIEVPENLNVEPETPLRSCPAYAGQLTVLSSSFRERAKTRLRNLVRRSTDQHPPVVDDYLDVQPRTES